MVESGKRLSGPQLGAVGEGCKGYARTSAGKGKVFYLGRGTGYPGTSPTHAFAKTHTIIHLTRIHFVV